MAKSDASRLKEAIDRGDLDLAKKLAEKIDRKAKTAPKPRRARRPAASAAGPPEEPPRVIVPGTPEYYHQVAGGFDPSYMAPTRGQKVGPDGRVRVEGRRVSLAGREHINIFDQWIKTDGRGAGKLDERTARAERQIAKNAYATPRPGMPGAKRDVARQIELTCTGCGVKEMKYPSEYIALDSDSGYKCDRCVRRGR